MTEHEIRVIRHASATLQSLNRCRKEGLLCDVTIIVGTETYLAHRYVLAVSSEYFRNLFSEEKKEEVVKIEDTSPQIVKQCIEYIYTGSTDINDENVTPLWDACAKLQLPDIADRCADYLLAIMDGKHCLFARELAIVHEHEKLKKAADDFGLANLDEIIEQKEFLELTKADLLFFLDAPKNDDLSPTVMYHALIKWIHYDFQTRSNEFPTLLRYVKMNRFSNAFLLQTIRNEPLFSVFDESRALLEYELFFRLSKETPSPTIALFDASACLTKAYNINTRKKCTMRSLAPDFYENCTAVCLEEYLYALKGGRVYRLNCSCKMATWSRMPDLQHRRVSKIQAGVLKHYLYVVGGKVRKDGEAIIATEGECYHPSKNCWFAIRDMPYARYRHVVVGCGDFLYCIGGHGRNGTIMDCMDKYEPDMGIWTPENSPMNRPRADATAISHCGRIYVLGGEIEPGKITNSVEYFVPLVGTWTIIARMVLPRSIFSAVIFDDKLFAIGGVKEQEEKSIVSMETMNLDNNTWILHDNVKGIGKLECAVIRMV